jgi:predicted dehydrogenase
LVWLLGERLARFWAQQPDVEVVAVADGRLERATEVAKKCGAGSAYASAEELIVHARPDAVSIATPDFVHREPVVTALQGGAHVLVEKPLALTTDDARTMIAAAERANRVLMVNHSMRWIPHFADLKRSIVSGELGDVVAAHSFKADTIHVPTRMLAWAGRSMENATAAEPRRLASGFSYVAVNGTLVLDQGQHTGATPGQALRHSGVVA